MTETSCANELYSLELLDFQKAVIKGSAVIKCVLQFVRFLHAHYVPLNIWSYKSVFFSKRSQCTVPQNLNLFPFSSVRVIRFTTNRKYAFFIYSFTRLDCHLPIITLIQWIEIDHLLL